MIQYIKTLIYGVAAKGVPVSSIASTTHTTLPDETVPPTEWHMVIYSAIKEVQQKLKD